MINLNVRNTFIVPSVWQWSISSILILVSVFLLIQRIGHRTLPAGDEGPWLTVANEFSKGHGFSINWLQYHYATPYQVPRPDDSRFPGLVVSLGLAFKILGASYYSGLWVTVLFQILFQILLFFTLKRAFGIAIALTGLAMTVFSPLQQEWSTYVLSESLFSLVLCMLVYSSLVFSMEKRAWWVGYGISASLLYLVRPNAILLIAGLPALFIWQKVRGSKRPWHYCLLALLCFTVVLLPYWIRNWLIWDNAFHFFRNAGMWRGEYQEPETYTFLEFISKYGWWFQVKKLFIGTAIFFKAWHFYENGLEILPLLFAVIGIIRRKVFFNPFISLGFFITFLACGYFCYLDWGGVRYFTPFMPFVYAYGAAQLLDTVKKIKWLKTPGSKLAASLIAALLLVAPVYYPNRYFIRKYSGFMEGFRQHTVIKNQIDEHTQVLKKLCGTSKGPYLTRMVLGHINFYTGLTCVGFHESYILDSAAVARMLNQFDLKVAVFTPKELRDTIVQTTLYNLERNGRCLQNADSSSLGIYFYLVPCDSTNTTTNPDKRQKIDSLFVEK